LKLIEHRSTSALTLVECAILHDTRMKTCDIKFDYLSSFQVHRLLVRYWQQLRLETCVHIIIENEREEMLTALYMQNVMKEANIESKICFMSSDFVWHDNVIVDKDGHIVKIVWTLWNWQRIFCETVEHDNKNRQIMHGTRVYPSDILLTSNIRVIEARWKSITTHRAMLRILPTMFPRHSHLEHLVEDHCSSTSSMTDTIKEPTIVSWMIHGISSGFGIRDSHNRTVSCVI
jgi:glutathionylspermidine synthase